MNDDDDEDRKETQREEWNVVMLRTLDVERTGARAQSDAAA